MLANVALICYLASGVARTYVDGLLTWLANAWLESNLARYNGYVSICPINVCS